MNAIQLPDGKWMSYVQVRRRNDPELWEVIDRNPRALERYPDTRVEEPPSTTLDLASGEIQTVLWATGFRPDYHWLDVDVLDHKGRVKHDGGVTASPGMYLIGTPFLRRRKSSFIHGATDDATDLADHLANHLEKVGTPQ